MYEIETSRMPDGDSGYAVVSRKDQRARGVFRIRQDAENFLHLVQEPDLADMIDKLWTKGNSGNNSKKKR